MAEEYKLIDEPFRPLNPPIRNFGGARSRTNYLSVLRQFDVTKNPRYTPGQAGHGETYCNVFVWDVTSAMQCEIPHWYDPKTGEPRPVGQGAEMNANAMCEWLAIRADEASKAKLLKPDFCWHVCVSSEAAKRANDGFPAMAVWRNPVGIGHVAMVMPSTLWIPAIAQAGAKNYWDVHVSRGFGNHGPIKYYWHD